MGVKEIIGLLSGVALFLFGMSVMGDGLKKASGNKLEPILFRLTNTMPKAVILGAAVTAVIQSSCATAVMVVGFVNSGMMKVRQGIYVTLGAILGTSITGWIICLSYIEGAAGIAQFLSTATLTGVVALTGIIMKMFAKKQGIKNIGDILLGFAVLMFGMSAMSGSVGGLREEAWFTSALTSMSNPFLGILVGTAFTALLQSASAAVGIVQALSTTHQLRRVLPGDPVGCRRERRRQKDSAGISRIHGNRSHPHLRSVLYRQRDLPLRLHKGYHEPVLAGVYKYGHEAFDADYPAAAFGLDRKARHKADQGEGADKEGEDRRRQKA